MSVYLTSRCASCHAPNASSRSRMPAAAAMSRAKAMGRWPCAAAVSSARRMGWALCSRIHSE
eukprot:1235390-Prymnesium_polylepis.2